MKDLTTIIVISVQTLLTSNVAV